MDTPMGNIAKNLMDGGAKLGVSTRGMGSLTKRTVSTKCKKTSCFLRLISLLILQHQCFCRRCDGG